MLSIQGFLIECAWALISRERQALELYQDISTVPNEI